jgi:hypothetical protein
LRSIAVMRVFADTPRAAAPAGAAGDAGRAGFERADAGSDVVDELSVVVVVDVVAGVTVLAGGVVAVATATAPTAAAGGGGTAAAARCPEDFCRTSSRIAAANKHTHTRAIRRNVV